MSSGTSDSDIMAVRNLRAHFEAMSVSPAPVTVPVKVLASKPERNAGREEQQPVPRLVQEKPTLKPKPHVPRISRKRHAQIRRKSRVVHSQLEQGLDVTGAPVDPALGCYRIHADPRARVASPTPPARGRVVSSNGEAAQRCGLATEGREAYGQPEEAPEDPVGDESDIYENVASVRTDDDRSSEDLDISSDFSEDDQLDTSEIPSQEDQKILVRCPALPPTKAGTRPPVTFPDGRLEPSLMIPPSDARRFSLPGLQIPEEIAQYADYRPPVPAHGKKSNDSLKIPPGNGRRLSLPGLDVSNRASQSEWYCVDLPTDWSETLTDGPSNPEVTSALVGAALPEKQYKFERKPIQGNITIPFSTSPKRSRSPVTTRGKKNYLQKAPLYQDYHRMTLSRTMDHQRRLPSCEGTIGESEDEFDSDGDYEFPRSPPGAGQGSRGDVSEDDRRRESVALLQECAQQRVLWQHLPHVVASGVLATLPGNVKKQQEAMFEVLASEASYLKSISIVTDLFMTSEELNQTLNSESKKALFSSIADVKKVTESFIAELGDRVDSDILIPDICDIVYKYAMEDFRVYIPYLTNNRYQEKKFTELRDSNPQFMVAVQHLQESPECGRLPFTSFLHLPLQRITRLRLLMESILKGREVGSMEEDAAVKAVDALDKVIKESNESVRKMQQVEEMINIHQQIVFENVKTIGLISKNRWLVKQGEVMELTNRGTIIMSRHKATPIHIFLFNDMLLLCSKKRDKFVVVDHVHRAMLKIKPNSDSDVAARNSFFLVVLENHVGKHIEKLLQVSSPSDMERWTDAICPPKKETDSCEQIYEDWDCPQVHCIREYRASQFDELTLQLADVINVLKKTVDDWMEGERLSDGEKGWFPADCVEEIKNIHVRARNLHQRYRLICTAQRMQMAPVETAEAT